MIRYTDGISGKEYLLYRDERTRLAGYYYADTPKSVVLYCAESGYWYVWAPADGAWRHEQEYCRLYFERRGSFVRILAPEGLPLPDEAERAGEEERKEKLREWEEHREKSRLETEIEDCDSHDVTIRPDGSCAICDGWEYDIPLGVVGKELVLDARNAARLFELIGWETDVRYHGTLDEERRSAFWERLNAYNKDGERLESLFEKEHIAFRLG